MYLNTLKPNISNVLGKNTPQFLLKVRASVPASDSNWMIHLGLVCAVFPYNCDPQARGSGLTNHFPFDALQCFNSEVSQQSLNSGSFGTAGLRISIFYSITGSL